MFYFDDSSANFRISLLKGLINYMTTCTRLQRFGEVTIFCYNLTILSKACGISCTGFGSCGLLIKAQKVRAYSYIISGNHDFLCKVHAYIRQ